MSEPSTSGGSSTRSGRGGAVSLVLTATDTGGLAVFIERQVGAEWELLAGELPRPGAATRRPSAGRPRNRHCCSWHGRLLPSRPAPRPSAGAAIGLGMASRRSWGRGGLGRSAPSSSADRPRRAHRTQYPKDHAEEDQVDTDCPKDGVTPKRTATIRQMMPTVIKCASDDRVTRRRDSIRRAADRAAEAFLFGCVKRCPHEASRAVSLGLVHG